MSSLSRVYTYKLGKIGKHPEADRLSIVSIDGHPVIFQSGLYQEGDVVAFIPYDMMVPNTKPFQGFNFTFVDGYAKVKAVRLRGRPSWGIIIPAPRGIGPDTDVTDVLGCKKYELPLETRGDNRKDPGIMPIYTDIEHWLKWSQRDGVVLENEEWVFSEKVHGANARFTYYNGELIAGSRNGIKAQSETLIWYRAAREDGLEEKLKAHEGYGFYGEVYGQVQDLKYDLNTCRFACFDIWDIKNHYYLPWDETVRLCKEATIPMVNELARGIPASLSLEAMANGKSTMANNVREGWVGRPLKGERYHDRLGRVILKYVGHDYLTRKSS